MTGAALAARLSEAGVDPAVAAAKIPLFDSAIAAYRKLAAPSPPVAWWVPGRLEVFGTHTDYAGGRTMIAAVPRGFLVLAGAADGDAVHAHDAVTGDAVVLRPDGGTFQGWRHYAEVVVSRLERNFPGARRGAAIVFASDVPRASGMSSSSVLVVGMATALARIWALTDRPEWRREIGDRAALAAYLACVENGMSYGALVGDAGVGTHGGSEDHAAMLLARPAHLSVYAFVPMRHLADVAVPAGWQFVIASSGVKAEKTGSARAAYNRLAEGVDVLKRLANVAGSLPRALEAGAEADLRTHLERTIVPGWPRQALERRLTHLIAEDRLVMSALDAFGRADRDLVGRLSAESQTAAEQYLGNQISETIELTAAAREAGAFAARSFGAGFGGSVWALVEAVEAEAFANRWLALYRERCPATSPSVFVAPPGPALVELGAG